MPDPFAPTLAARGIVMRQSRHNSDLELDVLPDGDPRNPVVDAEGNGIVIQKSIAPFLGRNLARDLPERGYYIDFEGVQHDL